MNPVDPSRDVLERNLERLFARAYEPVQPSAEFRGRLRLVLESGIARPDAARVGTLWRAAAAILLLLGGALLGWTMLHRSTTPLGVEQLLADGRAAVREVPSGPWRPLTDDEIAHGVELAAAPIELATPVYTSARPVRVEIEPGGELEVGPGSRLSVRRPDPSPGDFDLALEGGQIALDRRNLPGSWRITTSEGALRLASGQLEIACLDHDPFRRVRAKLISGSAVIETEPPFSLPTGREVFLAGGKVLDEPELEPSAEPTERANADVAVAPEATEVPVVPPAGATLRSRLVVPEGQALPESFVVTLLRSERLPQVSEPFSRTFLGESGEFSFEDLRPGSWSVFVQAAGFAVWATRGVELAAGKSMELICELDSGVALRGRVLDADGAPIEGALVLAEEDTPVQVLPLTMTEAPPSWTAATRSDAEGAFELPHLRPGQKTLRATRAGFGAGWSEPIDPALVDPSVGVEVRLTRPGAIEGRVAHDDGASWPGARVIASFLDMSYQRPCMSFSHAVAGPDGRYAIEDLPPGFYVAFNASEVSGSGGPVSPRIVQARVEPGERVKVDLPGTLRGTSVEGKLVSASGDPMKGFDVTLVPCGRGDQGWKAARSGNDGSFHFPDLAPGAYYVFVGEGLGVQFIRQEIIEVPTAPVFRPTITVASGAIRGRVTVGATGEGLPMSIVVVETEGVDPVEFVGKTMSDAHGRYEFLLLPPGRYRVTAYATSGRFGQETRSDVDVPAQTLDFALAPGAGLTIRVTDASGRAVHGAEVLFTSESGASVSFSPHDATDANGVFHVQGVNPGRWTVTVSRKPEGRAEAAIELATGEDRTLEIELTSDH